MVALFSLRCILMIETMHTVFYTCAHAFQQQDFSDVDLLLLAPSDVKDADLIQIRRLPGHMLVLGSSPVLKAQVRRCHLYSDSQVTHTGADHTPIIPKAENCHCHLGYASRC